MADPFHRDEENPFVGSGMHKSAKFGHMSGRTERRALARGYGMPQTNSATKKTKKKGKK